MTIQETIDHAYATRQRVEVEWKEGWGDYTGYGCLTDGMKGRFYIGKSTGTKPIYLTILKRNSWGGGGLSIEGIKNIRLLGVYR